MKSNFIIIVSFICLSFVIRQNEAKIDIKKLIASMNNEEKCGQMTQVSVTVVEKQLKPILPEENPIDIKKLLIAIKDKKVGSILDTPFEIAQKASTWQKIIKTIQDVALNETPLKIPVLYGIDSIHGATYIRESVLFPQPLGIGSTFNTNIAFQIGEIAAKETRACGIPWNFSPILDVGRQVLWPRFFYSSVYFFK
jgi:beta-glucosidase